MDVFLSCNVCADYHPSPDSWCVTFCLVALVHLASAVSFYTRWDFFMSSGIWTVLVAQQRWQIKWQDFILISLTLTPIVMALPWIHNFFFVKSFLDLLTTSTHCFLLHYNWFAHWQGQKGLYFNNLNVFLASQEILLWELNVCFLNTLMGTEGSWWQLWIFMLVPSKKHSVPQALQYDTFPALSLPLGRLRVMG